MIDVVVLDLDDTLLDHRGSAARALEAWLPTLGVTASAEITAAWFALEERYWAAWLAGRFRLDESRRRRMAGLLSVLGRPAVDDAALDELFARHIAAYEASWAPFPDAIETLAALAGAGLRLAVLTNGAAAMQRAKVAAIGASPYLEAVFTAEDLQLAKPDPATFQETCRRLGAAPGQVLHVGDRHDLDVVAARAAGLRAVHLDRRDAGPPDEPERITTLRDLPRIVAGRGDRADL